MQMRKEQYRADMLYQVSLSVAKTMREKGLITADEYVEIDTMLLEQERLCACSRRGGSREADVSILRRRLEDCGHIEKIGGNGL